MVGTCRQILRVFWFVVVGFAGDVSVSAGALAQDFPTHSITIVVGFPPGGPTDTVARIVADQMSKSLGQSIVVENVPGAAGTIGGARVVRAKPDGYTLSVGQWTSNVGAGIMYPLSYHVMDDFEPVALLTTTYLWIVGRKNLPANDLRELIAWLRENPGKASTGSIGVGSAAQVCTIEFQNKTDTKNPIVQYRGGAPAVQDLLGGLHLHRSVANTSSRSGGAIEGFRRRRAKALVCRARSTNRRRSWRTGHRCSFLAWAMGSERHSKRHYRQTQ